MNDSQPASHLSGWTTLYHPRGPRCTLPLSCDPEAAFRQVEGALDCGWLVSPPGLDAGEEKEQIGWVVRTSQDNDGELTPVVLLYPADERLVMSCLKVYLNTPADEQAFEYASKLKLDQLPEYAGNDKPERGQSKTARFFAAAPKPFGVVMKNNPKYDADEAQRMKAANKVYKFPRRVFVRWESQPPAKADAADVPADHAAEAHPQERPTPPAKAAPQQASGKGEYGSWLAFSKAADERSQKAVGLGYAGASKWRESLQALAARSGKGQLGNTATVATLNDWCVPALEEFFAQVAAAGNRPLGAEAAVELVGLLTTRRLKLADAAHGAGVKLEGRQNASDLSVREAELIRRSLTRVG